MPEIVMNW